MNLGPPLKQDLGWCPYGKQARKEECLTFQGPFRYVTACLEKVSSNRKNRWCLMFITGSVMVVMPVPHASPKANPDAVGSAKEARWEKPAMRQWIPRDSDSVMLEHLDNLVRTCREKDPDEVIIAEHGTEAIPLDMITDITITWVRNFGRYTRFLDIFGQYPIEPANARYRVNYRLEIKTGNKRIRVITPFSLELRHTLRDLLGNRVHEIPDEYAPIL